MHLDDVPREWLVAVAAAGLVFVAWTWLRAWLRGVRLRMRFDRAAAGEREAGRILEDAGFEIEGAQIAGGYTLHIDGKPIAVEVRADYLVRRGRARYVAEVKTGQVAPKITTAATRRQLLDYQHAFEVDGLLLVDAEARRIHRVELPRVPLGFFARIFG